jgi:hypothetical protein
MQLVKGRQGGVRLRKVLHVQHAMVHTVPSDVPFAAAMIGPIRPDQRSLRDGRCEPRTVLWFRPRCWEIAAMLQPPTIRRSTVF